MYGTWSISSFGLVAAGVAILVALAFLASPLIAVIVALVAIPVFAAAMVFLRRRQAEADPAAPEGPVTPEGKPTSPTGSRSRGAPASGEG
jgi:hypothetical protein